METAKVYREDEVERDEGVAVKVLKDDPVLVGEPGAAAVHRCGMGAMQLVVTTSSQLRARTLTVRANILKTLKILKKTHANVVGAVTLKHWSIETRE